MSKTEEPQFENVTFEQAEASLQAAAEAADDREEIVVDFAEVAAASSKLDQGSFEAHVGKTFVIDCGGQDVELELKEVNSLGEAVALEGRNAPRCAPFNVVFQGKSTDALLPDGLYCLRNSEAGDLELYLTRTECEGEQPDQPLLEAVFN